MKPHFYFLGIVLCMVSIQLKSQAYHLYPEQTPYVELSNPEIISTELDEISYRLKFNGAVANNFDLTVYGFEMDDDSVIVGTQGYVLMASHDGNKVMALDPFVPAEISKLDETSSISHKIQNVDGINYYVVQWKNVQSSEYPGKYLNYQLWLQEGGENVHFHYGPSDIPTGSNSPGGIQCGVFHLTANFQVVTFTVISGDAASPEYSSVDFEELQKYPAPNTLYKLARANPVGIDHVDDNATVKIYPNPSNGQIHVELKDEGLYEILDYNGRVLQSHMLNAGRNELQTDLPSGMYFFRSEQDNKVFIRKFIVN